MPRDTGELTGGGALVLFLRADCPACGLTVERWLEAIASGDLAGAPVVGITTDSPETVAAYREEKGVPFPVYRSLESLTLVTRDQAVTAYEIPVLGA